MVTNEFGVDIMRIKNRLSGRYFRKKDRSSEELELQITSLADVLIVVLIFLIKSISTDLQDMEAINVPQGVRLPTVHAADVGKDGLRVEVTESSVNVGGTAATALRSYRFHSDDLNRDLEQGGTSKALSAVMQKLSHDSAFKDKDVWVVADSRAPYRTIQTVLASAAVNGFSNFKLAVIKAE